MSDGNPNDPDRYTANESVAIRAAAQALLTAWDGFEENGPEPLDDLIEDLRKAVFEYPQRAVSPRGERERLRETNAELMAALSRAASVLENLARPDMTPIEIGQCARQARAAIAKARGT